MSRDKITAVLKGPLRWVFIIIAVILGLMVASVIALRLLFDLNDYRAEIERRATEVAGKPVRILGELSWALGLTPTIALQNIEVGPEKNPDARLGEVTVGLPLSALFAGDLFKSQLPGQLNVALRDVVLGDRDLGDYTAPIKMGAQSVSIDPLEGELPGGGSLTATVSYINTALKAEAEVADIDYAMVMPGASGGDMQGHLSLSSNGANLDTLLGALDGTVALQGGSGRLSGDAVRLWADDLLSTLLTGPSSHTNVTCLALNGTIKNGILRPSLAVLDTDSVRVAAKGSIDLVKQRLNLLVTPAPKQAALISLATPVRVQGSWDNPSVNPDGRAVMEKVGGLLLGAIAPPVAIFSMAQRGDTSASPCLGDLGTDKK